MALIEKLYLIDTLTAELDKFLPMSLNSERTLWKKIRLDWNYNSNHIEGNTLTYGETQLLIIYDKTSGNHELREYEEMKAHDVAIQLVKDWAKDKTRDLSESNIRELNKIILVKPFWKDAITADGKPTRRQIKVGTYKEQPNSVRLKNGEIFEYTSPLETPQRMGELLQWYRNNDTTLHPLTLASQLHYDFVRIHPFDDGNGRVARLIANYVLMKKDLPPIIVKSNEKDKYLTALNKADSGDINAFHEYMADQLVWSLELAIKSAKGEQIEEPEDLDKKLSLLETEIAHIDVDDEVQINFSKDVFLNIFDTWLSELIKGLIKKIEKFNKFFVRPTHYINIQTGMVDGHDGIGHANVNFSGRSENDVMTDLRVQLLQPQVIISSDTKITIHASYGTFRKGALKNPFGCNYHVNILFDYIKYEIYMRRFVPSLYNYPFFSNELKQALENNSKIKTVYFDAYGNFYYNVSIRDDGTKFVKIGNTEETEIVLSYPSIDILNGKVKDGGMERVIEPRLLHKPITKLEVEQICNQMGNTIYEHIDHYTKLAGLR